MTKKAITETRRDLDARNLLDCVTRSNEYTAANIIGGIATTAARKHLKEGRRRKNPDEMRRTISDAFDAAIDELNELKRRIGL